MTSSIPLANISLSDCGNLPQFKPEQIGLDKDFVLTKYAKLKGWGCKIPQAKLLDLLEGIGSDAIGMDCSIVPSQRYKDFFVVSTTDFFYPLVEDPYLQGRVGAANVLSDMYALGVVHIDNVLMILAASLDIDEKSRNIVTRNMMKGFSDCCKLANTDVTGGQSVLNPWPIIGIIMSIHPMI